MQDTRVIQASALRSHEELLDTRKQVQEAEEDQELEQELSKSANWCAKINSPARSTGAAWMRPSKRKPPVPIAARLRSASPCWTSTTSSTSTTPWAIRPATRRWYISQVIKETLRPTDSVARYGGEEFIILLPEPG